MRLLFLIFILCVAWSTSYARAAEIVFFESLYDVPVMVGLSEVKDQSVSFDKAEGRIAYAAAIGDDIDETSVLSFYSTALQQLGWHKISPHLFQREQEKLEISLGKSNASELIMFSINPVSQ